MNSWGHGIIEVGQEDIHELEGCDIVAFQFAEAGAMGYHAGVFFVTAECKVYFTWLYGAFRLFWDAQVYAMGES